jgi:ribosome-associated protein
MQNYPIALQHLLSHLDEIQAIDIKIIDVMKQTAITDYMVIATGRSARHVKSIAEIAIEKMKSEGHPILGSHGLETGEWALIDFGDYVLHVMQPDTRAFYNIEGLWQ